MHEVFRPWFGRALTIAIGVICVATLIALLATDGLGALLAVPWLALVLGACWATFWRPEVAVDDGGVRLVNVFRTIDVPWPAIYAIDTKWALTLTTAYGRFTAWAAPAPGAREAVRAARRDAQDYPESKLAPEGIRPGDLPSSQSGEAASVIRRHWQQLRDAGHLENPRLEHERAPITWHVATIVAGVTLLALGMMAIVL